MSTDEANSTVRFTVKELILDLRHDVRAVLDKLDTKASTEDLDQLTSRVSVLERWKWTATGFLLAVQFAIGAYLKYGQ